MKISYITIMNINKNKVNQWNNMSTYYKKDETINLKEGGRKEIVHNFSFHCSVTIKLIIKLTEPLIYLIYQWIYSHINFGNNQ